MYSFLKLWKIFNVFIIMKKKILGAMEQMLEVKLKQYTINKIRIQLYLLFPQIILTNGYHWI